jgi:shikimate dehydrogenase
MAAHPGTPFDVALLHDGIRVADIVYRPADTALLEAARVRGIRTMTGLGMAMHQAADAFEIFTGERADRTAMLADLHSLVAAEAATTPATPETPSERGENR